MAKAIILPDGRRVDRHGYLLCSELDTFGKPCTDRGIDTGDGRQVCWVHRSRVDPTIPKRPKRAPPPCAQCHQLGHYAKTCPTLNRTRQRKATIREAGPRKIQGTPKGGPCVLCGDYAHRVEGEHCQRCGRKHQPLPELRVVDFLSGRNGFVYPSMRGLYG